MVGYKRCKACGFIIEVGKLKEVCPACGAPASVFVEYTLEMKEDRKKILDRHIHPIAVHFPETIGILIFFLSLISLMVTGSMQIILYNTLSIMGILSPFVCIVAFFTGIFDGKVRFKRLDTPFLKKKISMGIMLFIITIVIAIISLLSIIEEFIWLMILLSIAHVGLAGGLGLFGGQLTCVAMKN